MKNTKIALQGSAASSSLFTPNNKRNKRILTIVATAASIGITCAESEEHALAETTIIANRTETDLSKVGSAVSILNVSELEQSGILYLDDALKYVPGVISESIGGQRGSISSLFLRGTNTKHGHIRVDGFRISGPNMATGNFFGVNDLSGLSRIEVLRGPHSALYGGDAIGGVLGIYSKKGSGTPGGSLSIGGGSFNSFSSALTMEGQIDRLSYALGIGYQETDNDLPNNQFEQLSYALRLDYAVNDSLDVGLTLRGFESQFRRPDYADPAFSRAADDSIESTLATIFVNSQLTDQWHSKLTLGIYQEKYDSSDFEATSFYTSDGQKYAAYWDNTIEWDNRHTTTAGLVYEKTNYDYASFYYGLSTDSRDAHQYGAYINHSWDVTDALTLTGGIRWEDYDTYGDEFTWRGAAAYRIEETNTKFRASIGRGFRPPSFIDIYGFGGTANFDLAAEQSTGWDIGIDQQFCNGSHQISLGYFENRIEDFITSIYGPAPTYTPSTFNASGTSITRGIELEAHGRWLNDRIRATFVYTWLDESLSGQPEHSAGLRVSADVTDKLETGLSINYLDHRKFNGNELDPYILVNLHANYQLSSDTTLTARIENVFDSDYEFFNSGPVSNPSKYPGRGAGFFAGITYQW